MTGDAVNEDLRASPASRVWTVVALLGLLVFGTAAIHLAIDAASEPAPWMNNDTAFLMFVAQEMDAGARLYVDWHDPDPPSIFFVLLAAVQLSRVGIPTALAYDLLVLLAGAAGLAVLTRSLIRAGRPPGVVVMTAAAYLLFVVKPGAITRDFGQREHLFALLLIPEVFALWVMDRGRWRGPWVGALAFAAMMKPQFFAILAGVELVALRRRRLAAGEIAGFAIGAVAPFLLLLAHSAESFTALLSETLMLHLSGAYSSLNRGLGEVPLRGPLIMMAMAIVATAAMAAVARRDVELRPTAGGGVVALALSAVGFVQQQKYFPYHAVPIFGIAVVCGTWAAAELGLRLPARYSRAGIGLATVVLLSVGLATFHHDVSRNGPPVAVRLGRAVSGPSRMLVLSVYSHGLCTPYEEAPVCVGPRSFEPSLPALASAADRARSMRPLTAALRARINEERPELLAISASGLLMPEGVTPASLTVDGEPIFAAGEYVPLSDATLSAVRAPGWLLLRRRDVIERVR